MKSTRIAGALTVLAALAVPATAAAHPSVYTSGAQLVANPATPDVLTPQTRYVVANHGFTYVLRETNGLVAADHQGVFDYKSLPGAFVDEGNGSGGPLDWTQLTDAGATGAQAHATCWVPSLSTEGVIRGWQGEDPFYAYVPFQKESAGLEDDPADWIAYVQGLTGVDLATATNPEAACEALPGATATSYVPADETQSTNAAFNSGLIEHTSGPLQAQIDTLTTALTGETNAKNALQGLLDAARAEIARLTVAATPVKLTLPSARLARGTLNGKGAKVTLSGPAGAKVTARLAISEARARKLGAPSSVLASRKATFGADGNAVITLKPGKRARKALRKLDSAIALTVTARSGARIATATGTLTR